MTRLRVWLTWWGALLAAREAAWWAPRIARLETDGYQVTRVGHGIAVRDPRFDARAEQLGSEMRKWAA